MSENPQKNVISCYLLCLFFSVSVLCDICFVNSLSFKYNVSFYKNTYELAENNESCYLTFQYALFSGTYLFNL